MDTLENKIMEVVTSNPRFPKEAYLFIYEALEHTVNKLGERRHITGVELLDGIREHAVQRFGLLSKSVFETWGVEKTEDFGEMVFTLVERGLLSKTETDTPDDFADGYDFKKVFEHDVKISSRIHRKEE